MARSTKESCKSHLITLISIQTFIVMNKFVLLHRKVQSLNYTIPHSHSITLLLHTSSNKGHKRLQLLNTDNNVDALHGTYLVEKTNVVHSGTML